MIKPLFRYFNSEGLLRDGTVLLAGITGAHVFNLLFQMVMGRCLPPGEFALLAALLGMFNVLALPLNVVTVSMTRYSGLLVAEGRRGDVRRLALRWGLKLSVLGLLLSLICLLFPRLLSRFVLLDRLAPIYIFSATLVGIFCRPVVFGVLRGLQSFWAWCICNVFGAGMRLVAGALLVLYVSPYAGWGLLAHGLGFYGAMILGILMLCCLLRKDAPSRQPLPSMHTYLFGSFLVLLGYSIMVSGDIVMIRKRFPEASGDFAYAATLGRLVLLAPQALVGSMFPKIVAARQDVRRQMLLFGKTIVATVLGVAGAAAVLSACARPVVMWIFNIDNPSPELVFWCRALAWTMVPVAALNVPLRVALAQHRLWITALVPVAAACYVTASYTLDGGPSMVLASLVAASTTALLLLCILVIRGAARQLDEEKKKTGSK